ncbi:Coq4 family protein [Hymenobacter algoricola]|uniref:Ubiquinone biosynthesis protein COQ4 n=1 Tax=Hymenobacter algoricola TaxID=486267 RepID=A0ABP7NUP9_9BACT
MLLSSQQPASLNRYQRLARKTIEHARTSVLIPVFWRLYGAQHVQNRLATLQSLPPGTLGRGVADLLGRHHLQLIPHYENHDLKHVLLGYDMTPEDELKLKAFMFGNGDCSITCLGFLALALLTPELWPELRAHYRRGRRTLPVLRWSLQALADRNLEALRAEIGFYEAQRV